MREVFKELSDTWKELFGSFLKWSFFSVLIGVCVGGIGSVFALAVSYVTTIREGYPAIIPGLPLGGLLIVFLYKISGQENNTGTNLAIATVREKTENIPGRIAPLIIVSAVVTHLFGGSSGRMGTAMQFGSSIGDSVARKLHFNSSDKKIFILACMSAAVSSVFGTPMAAAFFPMEVISIGVIYYAALVPCMFSAFVARFVAVMLGVHTRTTLYTIKDIPDIHSTAPLKIIVMSILFALTGTLFCSILENGEIWMKKWFSNAYIRVFAGGCAVVFLYLIVGTGDYLGLGGRLIEQSFKTPARPEVFLLKMIFTALTLCSGYKGGEVAPALFIGATLGSALSPLFGLNPDISAACGMAGVFCAVTNSPVTALFFAGELCGLQAFPYFGLAVATAYLLSGYRSLYKEQKIMYSKTEHKYINQKTK